MELLVVLVALGSVHGESSCQACNCQFNNVQAIIGLVESIVNDTLSTGLLLDNVVNAVRHQFGKVIYLFFSFVCIAVKVLCFAYSYLDTSDFDICWITEFRYCLHLPLSNS